MAFAPAERPGIWQLGVIRGVNYFQLYGGSGVGELIAAWSKVPESFRGCIFTLRWNWPSHYLAARMFLAFRCSAGGFAPFFKRYEISKRSLSGCVEAFGLRGTGLVAGLASCTRSDSFA
jgi:hypothetical protein